MRSSLMLFLISLLTFAMVMSSVAVDVSAATGIDPAVVFLVGATLTLVSPLLPSPSTPAVVKNGIDVSIWANYIIEKFYRVNTFLQHAYSDDQYVKEGKYVHIPQAGDKPNVVKNRSVFPAQVTRRKDHTIFYPLEWYTTDPTHITNADSAEISYNKMDSLIGNQVSNLSQAVADDLIIKWLEDLPQDNIIRTTGANSEMILPGATGSRKSLTYKDITKAATMLDAVDAPDQDRYALLSAYQYQDLLNSLSATEYKDFSRYMDLTKGVVGQIHGVNILKRSEVARMAPDSSDAVVKPWGSANETTDLDCAIVWQKDQVARALGTVGMFENLQDPTYYGDVYSAELFMGGRRRRADNIGVIAICQANG